MAMIKVFKSHKVFELAMNYKLVDTEKHLKRLDLRELLETFVGEDDFERPINGVRRRIQKSGHA